MPRPHGAERVLKSHRILVTGASGFVGSHLLRTLGKRGAVLSGLGPESNPAGEAGRLPTWHSVDLRDADAVLSSLQSEKPNAIVHLAGQSSAARSFEIPEETFAINALGTWNLLEATRRAAPRARVLVVGTSEVYGPQPEGTRVTESASFRPVSPYALSKAAADAFAEVFARQNGLDVIRTRSFGHTGPGQDPRFFVSSLAQQIATIEAGRAEPMIRVGNLDVTRDLLDVRDVAEAYVALLEHGTGGAAYNVCRGEGVRLDDVARRLIGRARVPVRIEVDPARLRPADVAYLVGDPGAIRRDTGWTAQIGLDRTFDDVLDEWRRIPPSG